MMVLLSFPLTELVFRSLLKVGGSFQGAKIYLNKGRS